MILNACLIEEFERLFFEKKEAENKFIEIFERLKVLESNRDFQLEKVIFQESILNELSIELEKSKSEIERVSFLMGEKIKEKEIIQNDKDFLEEKNREVVFQVILIRNWHLKRRLLSGRNRRRFGTIKE